MGLEHIGFIIGEEFAMFKQKNLNVLTGQQFQSSECNPLYVRFEDYSHAKFYEKGLREVCEHEGQTFNGIQHCGYESTDLFAGPYSQTGNY